MKLFVPFSASRNENSFPQFQANQFGRNNERFNDDSVQPFHKSSAADTQNIPIELSSNGKDMMKQLNDVHQLKRIESYEYDNGRRGAKAKGKIMSISLRAFIIEINLRIDDHMRSVISLLDI
jgi:hypothetical protein